MENRNEGEWTIFEVNGKNYGQVYYQHKECKVNETQLFPSPYKFCPTCGARMTRISKVFNEGGFESMALKGGADK